MTTEPKLLNVSSGTAKSSPWLYHVCLWLACGLLVAWSITRVKPAIWYGPIFGLMLGILGGLLSCWFPAARWRWRGLEVFLLAAIGTASSLWISSERLYARQSADRMQSMAEGLITSLETMPSDPASTLPPPLQTTTAPQTIPDRITHSAARRYRESPGNMPAAWLALELFLAGLVGAAVTRIIVTGFGPRSVNESTLGGPQP